MPQAQTIIPCWQHNRRTVSTSCRVIKVRFPMRNATVLLAFLLPVAANAATYTLADQNGVPSCTYVNLTIDGQFDYGEFHTERCSEPAPTLAGSGVSTMIRGSSGRHWTFAVNGSGGGVQYLFDIKSLTWVEYEDYTNNGLKLLGSGVLLKGNHKPPVAVEKR